MISGPPRRVVVAAWLAVAGAVWAAGPDAQTVRFAPERDYGPFVFADDQGRVQGLSVDLLARLVPAAGLRLQTLPPAPLAEQLTLVRAGQADLVSSLRPTPERGEFLLFTRPYVSVPAIVVVRKDRFGPEARPDAQALLTDLSGRSVAVGAGYGVESFVRGRYPRVAWAAVPDDVQALRGVSEGRHEAAVVDAASAAFVTQRHRITGLRSAGPIGFDYALSLAVPKDRPDLMQRLDAAIVEMPLHERTAILQRWMAPLDDHELMSGASRPLFWAGAWLGLGLVLGGSVMWRRHRAAASGDRSAQAP